MSRTAFALRADCLVGNRSSTPCILLYDSCARVFGLDTTESYRLGRKRQQYQREKRCSALDADAAARPDIEAGVAGKPAVGPHAHAEDHEVGMNQATGDLTASSLILLLLQRVDQIDG